MPTELDDLDRAILAALQENARLTNRAIAARVGSSEPTVRRRIDRLLEEQAVKVVAVASPFALGYGVMAILGLQIERAYQNEIEQALVALPEVRFVGLTIGNYDVILEVWLPNNDAVLDFLSQRLASLPGIHRVETWQVLKLSKYAYDWGAQPSV